MSLYKQIDFSRFRESDIQEAREFYGTNFRSKDEIKQTLMLENPQVLSDGIGAIVRGHYIKKNIIQPFKYTIEFLINHDIKVLFRYIQLDPNSYYYKYNIILSLYYADMISDYEKVNHPEFKRLVSLNSSELKKWGNLLRIPHTHLDDGKLLSKILETDFKMDTVSNIFENKNNIEQRRFNKIVEAINNNVRSYKDVESNKYIPLFDDENSLPFVLVKNYSSSSIKFSLIPLKDTEPINLKDALYVNDRGELEVGTYFGDNSNIINTSDIEKILDGEKVELILGNTIQDLYVVTKDMLTMGEYYMLLDEPSKNMFYADREPESYVSFLRNMNIPNYKMGQEYFRALRDQIMNNPTGLIVNNMGEPVTTSYAENMAIVIFKNYSEDQDMTIVWLTPIITNNWLDPLAMVENPGGMVTLLGNKLAEPLSNVELNNLLLNKYYQKSQGNMYNYYYMINMKDLINGDYPVPLPERDSKTIVIETVNSIN